MIKFVTVPAPVLALNPDGTPAIERMEEIEKDGKKELVKKELGPVDLLRYLKLFVFNEPEIDEKTGQAKHLKIGIGYEANERIHTLIESFKNAIAGDVVQVSGEDHKAVAKVILEKKPTHGTLSAQFYLIERAWIKADDKDPRVAASNGAVAPAGPPVAMGAPLASA